MISKYSTTYPDHLRLANVLNNLSETKLSGGNHNLAERLGHLLGLSGSVALAQTLQELPPASRPASVESNSGSNEVLYEKVIAARARMMLKITASFGHESWSTQQGQTDTLTKTADGFLVKTADGSSSQPAKSSVSQGAGGLQTRVPSADASIREQTLKTFAPYRRFYIAQQVGMAVGIQDLRTQVRDSVAAKSVALHQLAELDTMFEQSLASQNQKLFTMPLKVLERRFKFLLQTHLEVADQSKVGELKDWLTPGAWLDLFYQDTCELLLSEFDVRLQPVLGLLEALNEPIR